MSAVNTPNQRGKMGSTDRATVKPSHDWNPTLTVLFSFRKTWTVSLWPPDAKNRLIRKGPDAGTDWSQQERRMTEDEVVGWHHWVNRYESEWSLGDDEGQGRLACWPKSLGSQRVRHNWVTEHQQQRASQGGPFSMRLLSLDCGLICLTLPSFAIRNGPCLWHISFCLLSEPWGGKESSFCFVLWGQNDTTS